MLKVDGLVKRLVREEPLLSDSTKDAWIREVIRWKQIGDGFHVRILGDSIEMQMMNDDCCVNLF